MCVCVHYSMCKYMYMYICICVCSDMIIAITNMFDIFCVVHILLI